MISLNTRFERCLLYVVAQCSVRWQRVMQAANEFVSMSTTDVTDLERLSNGVKCPDNALVSAGLGCLQVFQLVLS